MSRVSYPTWVDTVFWLVQNIDDLSDFVSLFYHIGYSSRPGFLRESLVGTINTRLRAHTRPPMGIYIRCSPFYALARSTRRKPSKQQLRAKPPRW